MKRHVFVMCSLMSVMLMLLSSADTISAQIVRDNEQAVVYYMPLTKLQVDVEYQSRIYQPGKFAQYAKRYLGIDKVILRPDTMYNIENISVLMRTEADYLRAYKVLPSNTIDAQLLSLTDDGILYGYNIPPEDKQHPHCHGHFNPPFAHKRPGQVCNVGSHTPPFSEDIMIGKTEAEQARLAAEQIYRIRETRMYILGGEVDHAPADGMAMDLVLKELEAQENSLMELFAGKVITNKEIYKSVYVPAISEEAALFRFSESRGVIDTMEAEGTPIVITVSANKQVKTAPVPHDKKAPVASQIYYNLPGSMIYSLHYGDKLIETKEVQVAQLGTAVPLSSALFTDGKVKIWFNTETGNIKAINK